MKKNIIIFIIGITFVIAIFQLLLETDKELTESPQKRIQPQTKLPSNNPHLGGEILDSQVKKLAKKISSELTSEQLFYELNNYRVSTTTIIKNFKSEKLNNYLKNITSELNECLKRDYCGTKPDSDGYFDENQTPGHKLLARSLEILNEMKDVDLQDIDFESFLDYSNPLILSETAELFSKTDPSDEETITFLNKASKLDGDFKSQVFLTLLKTDMKKDLIVSELAKQLKDSDNYSIVSFFQNVQEIDLSSSELTELISSSCHIKENKISWNSLKYNLDKYSEKKGYSLRVSQVCL